VGKAQISGNVTWAMNWAEDDNGNPMNNYDLAAEWLLGPGSAT
jgi:hypothetical protein